MVYDKLAFSPLNEHLLRKFLFKFWVDRYYRLKQDYNEGKKLSPSSIRRVVQPAPKDLSGACKFVSQVAFTVFDFDGEVAGNRRHAFIRLSNGDIYDINRNCKDVRSMPNPYFYSAKLSNSKKVQDGLATWHKTVDKTIPQFRKYLAHHNYNKVKPRKIHQIPAWCSVESFLEQP